LHEYFVIIVKASRNKCSYKSNSEVWSLLASCRFDTQTIFLVLLEEYPKYIANLSSPHEPSVASKTSRVSASSFAKLTSGHSKGQRAGYPSFKGSKRYDSSTYPQYAKGALLRDGRLLLTFTHLCVSILDSKHSSVPWARRIRLGGCRVCGC